MMNNYDRPDIDVRFFELERFETGNELSHKSVCPVCAKGLLLMCRDSKTGQLLPYDVCTLCGQHFTYLDIDVVREERP